MSVEDSSSLEDRILELCRPSVEQVEAELLDVEYVGATLRIVVDAPPDGITTAQLTKINRSVSLLLDEEDPIGGRYTLEVSSPGLERRLAKPVHYARAVGETVVVKLLPDSEIRRIKGKLIETSDESIVVSATEMDGVELAEASRQEISLDDINKTRTVFEWGPKSKPGHPKTKRGKR